VPVGGHAERRVLHQTTAVEHSSNLGLQEEPTESGHSTVVDSELVVAREGAYSPNHPTGDNAPKLIEAAEHHSRGDASVWLHVDEEDLGRLTASVADPAAIVGMPFDAALLVVIRVTVPALSQPRPLCAQPAPWVRVAG